MGGTTVAVPANSAWMMGSVDSPGGHFAAELRNASSRMPDLGTSLISPLAGFSCIGVISRSSGLRNPLDPFS